MSFQSIHYLYGVGCGATLLGGITQQDMETGSEVRAVSTSGEPYPRFISLVGQSPKMRFSSHNIAAGLTVIGATGASIASLTSQALWAQKYATAGTRAGAVSHRKYSATKGIVVPTRLTCDADGDALIAYEATCVWDGTNDPIVITDSQTLTAGLTDAERFTIGPTTIGAETLNQPVNIEIDFGIRVRTMRDASVSNVWPSDCCIDEIQAKITLRGQDIQWFKSDAVPLAGKAATHANTTIYFRKRSAGGIFVADATQEHVKITAAGMAVVDAPGTFNASNPGETSLTMTCYYDGTNAPIVLSDLTSAIA